MITYINKDITTVEQGIIAHGVNCCGVLNSGVARAIRNKWPIVYENYKKMPSGKDVLGSAHCIRVNDNLFVINCYTQEFYGREDKVYADVDSVAACLDDVAWLAGHYDFPLYMPRIGCGLGGLDWDTQVGPIIEKISKKNNNINIYVCDLEK